MSANRNAALPSLLLFLVLLHDSVTNTVPSQNRSHTTSQPPVTYRRIIFVAEPEEPETPTARASSRPAALAELCDYDPCRDQQMPCTQLSLESGCLCPGLSGPNVLPQAPHLNSVRREGAEVVARWCAPASEVQQYRVTVELGTFQLFGEISRKGSLGNLVPGTKVCVEAINRAGTSTPSQYSCTRYEPKGTDTLALKAGLIAGGLTLLLLLSVVAFLLWRRKLHKDGSSSEGLGNPSFNTEGSL
nr:leucine-rich repeat neuronal protein 4-like [Paramormyrops kingsleyae]